MHLNIGIDWSEKKHDVAFVNEKGAVIAEDKVLEDLSDELSDSGGQVVSVTLSSQLTGELASVQAVTIGDAGDADAADAAGEAAHGEEEIIPGMLR